MTWHATNLTCAVLPEPGTIDRLGDTNMPS